MLRCMLAALAFAFLVCRVDAAMSIYIWLEAETFAGVEFINAPYLGDHPAVLDAFCERVEELDASQPAMNCQLCKYRTQIIGYETDAGAPQTGHHHHVRGIGLGDGHHPKHPDHHQRP